MGGKGGIGKGGFLVSQALMVLRVDGKGVYVGGLFVGGWDTVKGRVEYGTYRIHS